MRYTKNCAILWPTL